MTRGGSFHQPVMADEAVGYLITNYDGVYIDATAGGGGHTDRIISKLEPSGRVLAIDRDDEAVAETRKRLQGVSSQVTVIKGDFGHLKQLAEEAGMASVNGVLFDLGVSSHQLDCPDRGFSYRISGPLDLRMDKTLEKTAAEVVNSYSVPKLAEILYELGEEKNSRRIAAAIETARRKEALHTTLQLARVIQTVTNPRYLNKTLSRVFQAIRIEVNDELKQLQQGLQAAFDLLCPHGRLVVIAYHSLEDRLVKNMMRAQARKTDDFFAAEPAARLITKKPLVPSRNEIDENPRARSAKMRVLERLSL